MEASVKNLLKFINGCPNILEATGGVLELMGERYLSVRYKQECTPPAGARNPEKYINDVIYCIGFRPLHRRRKDKFAIVLEGEKNEWFVSCYSDDRCLTGEFAPHHPFGYTFQISPWDVAGKVDDGELKPYERVLGKFVA